jgi:hypothetical protein
VLWATIGEEKMYGVANMATFKRAFPVRLSPEQVPVPRAHVLTVGETSIWHAFKHPWALEYAYSTNAHALFCDGPEELMPDTDFHFDVRDLPDRCREGLTLDWMMSPPAISKGFDSWVFVAAQRSSHVIAIARAIAFGDLATHGEIRAVAQTRWA